VLVELVRVLREGAVSADASSLPLPERVQGAIAHRLGRLGERERHVVGAAAVIRREAAVPLLRHVAGLAERDLAEARAALAARRGRGGGPRGGGATPRAAAAAAPGGFPGPGPRRRPGGAGGGGRGGPGGPSGAPAATGPRTASPSTTRRPSWPIRQSPI